MENEKLTKDQLEIRKKENEKKNWEAFLAQATKDNNQTLIDYFKSCIEDCEKSIQKLKNKTSLEQYTALAPKKQEIVDINSATPTQKEQSKGKLNKLKVALAALGVAGVGIIAFLAGSKIQKDKDNADKIAKSLDDNDIKNEQESVQKDSKTDIEKIVDETIAEQDKQNEMDETKEQQKDQKEELKEDKKGESKKDESKKVNQSDNNASNKEHENKKNDDAKTSNPNNSSNNNGTQSNNTNSTSTSETPAIKGTITGVQEVLVETNEEQHVISESVTKSEGNLKEQKEEIVDNIEVKPNVGDGKIVEAKEEADNKTKAEAEAKAKAEAEAKAKVEAEAKAKAEAEAKAKAEAEAKAKADESNKIDETEEVIEDNVVLPSLSDEDLAALEAEINALINSKAKGDGFSNPNEEVEENSKGKSK